MRAKTLSSRRLICVETCLLFIFLPCYMIIYLTQKKEKSMKSSVQLSKGLNPLPQNKWVSWIITFNQEWSWKKIYLLKTIQNAFHNACTRSFQWSRKWDGVTLYGYKRKQHSLVTPLFKMVLIFLSLTP